MTTKTPTEIAVPTLEWVLSLHVLIDPADDLGACTDGQRSNYRITGGHFEGLNVRGDVLAGGADFYLQRSDGGVSWTLATACAAIRASGSTSTTLV